MIYFMDIICIVGIDDWQLFNTLRNIQVDSLFSFVYISLSIFNLIYYVNFQGMSGVRFTRGRSQ